MFSSRMFFLIEALPLNHNHWTWPWLVVFFQELKPTMTKTHHGIFAHNTWSISDVHGGSGQGLALALWRVCILGLAFTAHLHQWALGAHDPVISFTTFGRYWPLQARVVLEILRHRCPVFTIWPLHIFPSTNTSKLIALLLPCIFHPLQVLINVIEIINVISFLPVRGFYLVAGWCKAPQPHLAKSHHTARKAILCLDKFVLIYYFKCKSLKHILCHAAPPLKHHKPCLDIH